MRYLSGFQSSSAAKSANIIATPFAPPAQTNLHHGHKQPPVDTQVYGLGNGCGPHDPHPASSGSMEFAAGYTEETRSMRRFCVGWLVGCSESHDLHTSHEKNRSCVFAVLRVPTLFGKRDEEADHSCRLLLSR